MAPDSWAIVTVPASSMEVASSELAEEIKFALQDREEGGEFLLVHAPGSSKGFVDELASAHPGIVLLTGVEGLEDAQIQHLDLQRNRLVGVASFVILTTDDGAKRLAQLAPQLWSFVGAKVFQLDRSIGHMDVGARLGSLREATGLEDEEVVRRAEAGTLPSDPLYAEWLALLGKGGVLGS